MIPIEKINNLYFEFQSLKLEFRDLIKSIGISAAADILKINKGYLSKIANGKKEISIENIFTLLETLRKAETKKRSTRGKDTPETPSPSVTTIVCPACGGNKVFFTISYTGTKGIMQDKKIIREESLVIYRNNTIRVICYSCDEKWMVRKAEEIEYIMKNYRKMHYDFEKT